MFLIILLVYSNVSYIETNNSYIFDFNTFYLSLEKLFNLENEFTNIVTCILNSYLENRSSCSLFL